MVVFESHRPPWTSVVATPFSHPNRPKNGPIEIENKHHSVDFSRPIAENSLSSFYEKCKPSRPSNGWLLAQIWAYVLWPYSNYFKATWAEIFHVSSSYMMLIFHFWFCGTFLAGRWACTPPRTTLMIWTPDVKNKFSNIL